MGAPKASAAPTFKLLSPADIEALPDLEWLVDGILPLPAFGVLYGEPGCGKTFVALSMALAIASGQEWLGRKTRQANALYVAAEGVYGLKTRIQAHRHRFGLSEDSIRFVASPIEIMNPLQVAALLTDLKQQKFTPGLIVVDTLARVALGADENNARDMGQVVAGFDELKRQTGATVLVIHHTRKDGLSERGSSALRGAADVMITCEARGTAFGQGVLLKCAKMKDDEPFKEIGLILEKVELPKGKSSLVVGSSHNFLQEASGHADKIVEILEAQFGDKGATHGELRKAFVASGTGAESTFNRTWKNLRESDRVRIEKSGNKKIIHPASVSVSPVSNKCQTPADVSVMSPPSLGGDTDTKPATSNK